MRCAQVMAHGVSTSIFISRSDMRYNVSSDPGTDIGVLPLQHWPDPRMSIISEYSS